MSHPRFLTTIYQQPQTIFTSAELSLLFPNLSSANLSRRLNYYVKTQGLTKLRRGIYAKPQYSKLELGNKLYSPSYLSFATILFRDGLIFQRDSRLYLASYLTRQVEIANQTLVYRQLKAEILLNTQGLNKQDQAWQASTERAFLDTLYLAGNIFFDNLLPLDWTQVFNLQDLYASEALKKRVAAQYQHFEEAYYDPTCVTPTKPA